MKELFKRDYDYERMARAYYSSQYMVENPEGVMPDNALYNFCAGYYLRGGNPILVNPEHPPLGKYFLSLSVLFFQNTRIATYFFFYLTLLAFFLLARLILKNFNLALVTTLLFSFEKLFSNQLRYPPVLSIFQLCFILFSFFFFIQWLKTKKRKDLVLASLSLGITASVMFFITALVIFVSWVLFLLVKKRWQQTFSLVFWVGLSTYLVLSLSYLRVLLEEPNPLKALSIQKWILWFHQGKLTSIGTIWPLIYFNRWQTWWADRAIISDPQWWFGLPILFTFAFVFALIYWLKKIKDEKLELILFWFLIYSLFISFGQANIRYLLPILPFLYLILIKFLSIFFREKV